MNDTRTKHRKENPVSSDKKVEFQQDENFDASEFHIMGWDY